MTGDLGKQYLAEYLAKSVPLFESYLHRKIAEAKKVGKIPAELLSRFLAVGRRGKKIRGALVMLGFKAAGGADEGAALEAGLAVELLHAALLVHDDIMDQDTSRRGLVALHHQLKEFGKHLDVKGDSLHYGESMAGCVVDAVFYLSWDKLLTSNFPPKIIVEVGRVFADYAVRISWGQSLDISAASGVKLGEREILNILRYKSAEYTGVLPLLFGATLAGQTAKRKRAALTDYGLALGWAFQIQDDILGMFGDEEKVGKPIGSDLREGKNTLLMLHLAKHGTPEQQEFQQKVLGNKNITRKDVDQMRQALRAAGSYQYVVDLGWKYVADGKTQIPLITTDKKLRDVLESLIVYMMERVK